MALLSEASAHQLGSPSNLLLGMNFSFKENTVSEVGIWNHYLQLPRDNTAGLP